MGPKKRDTKLKNKKVKDRMAKMRAKRKLE